MDEQRTMGSENRVLRKILIEEKYHNKRKEKITQ
jgi:hypothetical protein